MFLANLCYVTMFIRTSRRIHNAMLNSVVRIGVRFFESTPTGRILNRFTRDIDATEGSIPESIRELIFALLAMTSILTVITSVTPYFLFALVPIVILFVLVQVRTILNSEHGLDVENRTKKVRSFLALLCRGFSLRRVDS